MNSKNIERTLPHFYTKKVYITVSLDSAEISRTMKISENVTRDLTELN